MDYESLKSQLKALLEKQTKNSESQKEFNDSFGKFQSAEAASQNLDDSIRQELLEAGRTYQESAKVLEQEREMIEAERGSMREEIQGRLADLQAARGKLESAAQGKYGPYSQEALQVCGRLIRDYQELLGMIGSDAGTADGGAGESVSGFQKERALLSELQVQENVVGMLAGMTEKQRTAVGYYTGSGYTQINPFLRGQTGAVSDGVKEQIRQLHSLLGNQRIRQPITVYRGVSHDTSMVGGSSRGLNSYSDQELCGKLLVDGAFVSTSLREDSAFSGTMLVLDLPAGTRGAYVGDISSLQHQEREFLMDMGQAFRVTRVERRNGKRYVYAKSIRK